MKKIKLFSILFLIFLYTNGYSQENPKDTTDIFDMTLEELMQLKVNIASKNSQKIGDAPAVVGIITKKDIESMGVISLVDVLKHIPAVEVSIDINGFYRLSLRGQRKNGNILMMVDNKSVIDFYNGLSIYDIPSDFIERIEIIRGPGSALFGTNAVAGVINIITNKKQTGASIKATSQMGYSGNFSFSKNTKKTSFSVNGGYLDTKGDVLNPRTDSVKTLNTNRSLRNSYLSLNFTKNKFNISAFGLTRRQGAWVGPAFDVSPDSKYRNAIVVGETSYQININKKISIIPKIYSQFLAHNYLIQEHPNDYTFKTYKYTDGALTKELYNSLKLGSELQFNIDFNKYFNLVSGVVFENLSLSNYDLKRNYNVITGEYFGELKNPENMDFAQADKSRNIFAVYMQAELKYKKIGITSGFRYDKYSDFGNSFNPRLGFVYKVVKNLRLKLLYGQAFRAPLFIELYDNTNRSKDGVLGNKDLLPENVHSSEFALEFTYKKVLLRTNFFYNISKDLIGVFDIDGSGGYGYYRNLGDLNNVGGETEIITILNSSFNFFINTSYFYSSFFWSDEILEEEPSIDFFVNDSKHFESKTQNIPNLRLNAGFTYRISDFSIFVSTNYGNAASNNKRSFFEYDAPVEIKSYLQANIAISYIYKNIKLSILANNLGQQKYSDPEAFTSIDKMGPYGMRQPQNSFALKLSYFIK